MEQINNVLTGQEAKEGLRIEVPQRGWHRTKWKTREVTNSLEGKENQNIMYSV